MDEAVLFVFFKRPEETLRVLARIREARPDRIYLVSDGPRPDVPGEAEIVQSLRERVLERVDWECAVQTRFREGNLGCHPSMQDAIDWFFGQEQQGIILEDDCLPDASFFPYCAEMLNRYRREERVMAVCGVNFLPWEGVETSYIFSRFCNVWGWASWRRAWERYDPELREWPALKAEGRLARFCTPTGGKAYSRTFDQIYAGKKEAWDAQWNYSVFNADGLAVVPRSNLVSNIGASGGSNTQSYDPFLNMETVALEFPLCHPERVEPDAESDRRFAKYVSPRNYRRTVRLMFRRWGPGAVSRLARAVWFVLRQRSGH